VAHGDALFAAVRELRPVRRYRRVVVDLPPVGQQVQRRRSDSLRRAEAHRDRVTLPRLILGTPPAPQVNDELAAVVDPDGCAARRAPQLPPEQARDVLEAGVYSAIHPNHSAIGLLVRGDHDGTRTEHHDPACTAIRSHEGLSSYCAARLAASGLDR
jgi:hypothetical protein